MVDAGAASMLDELDLDVPGRLLAALTSLLGSPQTLDAMASAARTQAHPDAAQRIAERLAELARRG
jgi:UDP-N-acetylglucosamine:LPS N-acetylglucosamine transferase